MTLQRLNARRHALQLCQVLHRLEPVTAWHCCVLPELRTLPARMLRSAMGKSDDTATSILPVRGGAMAGVKRAAATLLCAGLLASSGQALGETGLTGEWSGSYTCIQGLTSLDLSVEEIGAGQVEVLFHFSADSSNPRVPEGCFTMSGNFDAHVGRLVLLPGEWLMQPFRFITVGLDGYLDSRTDVISGRVTKMPGCKDFTLHRIRDAPVRAEGCHLERHKLSV